MIISSNKDIKNFYRAVEFTFLINNHDISHEHMKSIILNEINAKSYFEKELIKVRDAYLYLVNNSKQVLSLDMLDSSYFLLTKKHLNEEKLYSILSYYYQLYYVT